jgi:hypothetical protein
LDKAARRHPISVSLKCFDDLDAVGSQRTTCEAEREGRHRDHLKQGAAVTPD